MVDHEKSAGSPDSEGNAERPRSGAPKAYERPCLTVLGDVRTLTLGTTANFEDSGGIPGLGKSI